MTLSFMVLGYPEPQGSIKAFTPKGARFPTLTSDNADLKPWRQDVSLQALRAMKASRYEVSAEAVELALSFYFAKPRSAPKILIHKITRPDLDKCTRAILDALKGIIYLDDSQVVAFTCEKEFGLPERAEILVKTFAVKSPKGMTGKAT